jgi:hypothetical protein
MVSLTILGIRSSTAKPDELQAGAALEEIAQARDSGVTRNYKRVWIRQISSQQIRLIVSV